MDNLEVLGHEESVPDRPFADHRASEQDVATMRWMARHLRALAAEASEGDRGVYTHLVDDEGATHRIVVPNWGALQARENITAVGFFGQTRPDVNHSPIMDLENQLIERLPETPGLLTYYNLHRPRLGYGNLVLFESGETKDGWRDNRIHERAVERTPQHYYSVRLHNGLISGGIMQADELNLLRTKYFDFRSIPHWRAVREYNM